MQLAAAEGFVGRSREMAMLGREARRVAEGEPRVVLVEGESGMGKTRLVREFLHAKPQLRVLQASGDEEETQVPFSVVQQLTGRPAGTDAGSVSPLQVGAQLLERFSTMETQGSVAVVVDDLHWADVPSLRALLFALRRLDADRVLTVLACRAEAVPRLPEGVSRLLATGRGQRLLLGGLDVEGVRALTYELTGTELSRVAARRLREHTGGNPLYVTALLEELTPAQLTADGEDLPAPRSFAAVVEARLTACSPPTRRLVAAVAVGGGELSLADAAMVADVAEPFAAVDEAVSRRLLDVAGTPPNGRLLFVHRLVRTAVYAALSAAERADLHRRAAALTGTEGARLHHLVAATARPHAGLAAEVAAHAGREASRGAWGAAAAAFTDAARIAPTGVTREQALLRALEHRLLAGDADRAAELAAAAEGFAPSARRSYVLGHFAYVTGRSGEGRRLLEDAWRAAPGDDSTLRRQIARQAGMYAAFEDRGADAVTWGRRLLSTTSTDGSPRPSAAIVIYGLGTSGRIAEAMAVLPDLAPAGSEVRPEQIDELQARGNVRLFGDDLAGAVADLTTVAELSRRYGPFDLDVLTHGLLAEAAYRMGNWDDSVVHAETAVTLCADREQLWVAACVQAIATFVPARRGMWQRAEEHRAAAAAAAAAVPMPSNVAHAATAAAVLAHSRGEHADVLAGTEPLLALAGKTATYEPGILGWRELRTEALVRLGRLEQAEAELAPFEEIAADRGRRSAQAAAGRVRGLLEAARGRADVADATFTAALDHAQAVPMPFERALVELMYGEFLRRAGRRRPAQEHLHRAYDAFQRLVATPFVDRAGRELAGCGLTPTPRKERAADRLSPQELAVARLVAEGLTNRDVAAALVLSVKTVEYHLSNCYAKLGVRSRTALARLLVAGEPTAE
jgi:DNA-binding CsgD family transcriptional regulator